MVYSYVIRQRSPLLLTCADLKFIVDDRSREGIEIRIGDKIHHSKNGLLELSYHF